MRISRLLTTIMIAGLAVGFGMRSAVAQTAGGTVITNQASATYSDGTNPYSTVSNPVTVTVAYVSGLTISPDDTTTPSHSTVVPGQTNVVFTFTLTNIGNFTDNINFLAAANGTSPSASIQATGATITNAAIDVNKDGSIDAGDTTLFGNNANVQSANVAENGTIVVLVSATITATAGQTVSITLGDASGENQPAKNSAHEVRTVATTSVNGQRAAIGNEEASVVSDSELEVTMTAPSGPVALGSNITYSLTDNNPGTRTVSSITLSGAPGGSNTGVFIMIPIPVGTSLASGQTFPAGTLFTTSPLTTSPLNATWTTTAPGTLSTVVRIAFNVGNSIAVGATTTAVSFQVTISSTDNASNTIDEIADTFGTSSLGSTITDQSGDTIADQGDGNANFSEPLQGQTPNGTSGLQQVTTLIAVGNVLNGPNGHANAVGPTNNNDDYTNMGMALGSAVVTPGGSTTAAVSVVFTNTVQNTGNANDTYTLTAPTVPTGFTVAISTNGGTTYTTVSGGGSVTLPVGFGLTANYLVKVTVPVGTAYLAGYATTITATSGDTPANFNNTIDRVYTGFIQMTKSAVVTNGTGVGAANSPVPGAVIAYSIAYSNISSSGGTNCVTLTATGFTITENGNTSPNNWGTDTAEVVGSAKDTLSGTITGDTASSTLLTDTVGTLAPGASGTFSFSRTID